MTTLHVLEPLAVADTSAGSSLLQLPPEIVNLIVQHLCTCSDVVACMCASPVFGGHHLLDLLARSCGAQVDVIIKSGAPLEIVRGLYDRWRLPPLVGHIAYAAKGGRADVVRWMCESIARAPGSWDVAHWPYPEVPIHTRPMSPLRPLTGVHMPRNGGVFPFCVPPLRDDDDMPPSPWPLLDTEVVDSDPWGRSPNTAGSRPVSPDLCYGSDDEMGVVCSRGGSRPVSPGLGPEPDSLSGSMFMVYSLAGASPQSDTPSALAMAMSKASRYGHVDVIRYLVDACPLIGPPARLLTGHAIAEAARHGQRDVVAFAHERWTKPVSADKGGSATCCCPSAIARAAIDAHQHEILERMHAVGCRSFEATADALVDALRASDICAIDALTRVLDPKNKRLSPDGKFAREFQAHLAGNEEQKNYVDLTTKLFGDDLSFVIGAYATQIAMGASTIVPIALILSRGFTMFGAPQMVTTAASAGNLPLIKWAAGEAIHYRGERLAAPQGLPWNHPAVVLEAAFRNRLCVVEWLSRDPRCRSCLNPILARTLLLSNGVTDVVRWMHTSGLVPMQSWDALHAAVVHGGLSILEEVADMGGVYTTEALVEAVRRGATYAVIFLCKRYGTRDAQVAIDAWPIDPNRRGGVDWIVRNVPGLDIANIVSALSMLDKPKDDFMEDKCRLA
nr:hypothetical protein [Pandoravirus massiliensis]